MVDIGIVQTDRTRAARRVPGGRRHRFAVDVPTASEWAAWWSTPWPARLYVVALVLGGLAIALGAGSPSLVGQDGWVALAGLVAVAVTNGELGRLVEGGRVERQRLHKGLSAWPFAAALLATPAVAAWVAAAGYAHALGRGIRITRWKWIGSWGIVTLAAAAASAAVRLTTGGTLPAAGSPRGLAGVVVATAAFLAVEAGLLAVISRLNRQEDEAHLRAQLARPGFYLVEAAVLSGGAVAAVLLRYSPAFLLLIGPALLLVQRGMLHQPLREEARHDPKTGVLNYEAWLAAAAAVLRQARRERRRAAVLVIDLDHFKGVNDTRGHLVGDAVLNGAADAVVSSIRSTDVAGRFGGDELCALIVCERMEDAAAAAERIRDRIGALTVAPDVRVTASIGLALADPHGAELTVADLMATADRALYDAKAAGRNQVRALSVAG